MTDTIHSDRRIGVWVLGAGMDDPFLERLGDARRVADAIGSAVGAVAFGVSEEDARALIDRVRRTRGYRGYFAFHSGLRFSAKARGPSMKSSLLTIVRSRS